MLITAASTLRSMRVQYCLEQYCLRKTQHQGLPALLKTSSILWSYVVRLGRNHYRASILRGKGFIWEAMELQHVGSPSQAAASHEKSPQSPSVRHKEKLLLRYMRKKQANLKFLDLLLQLHHNSLLIFYLGIQLAHFKFFPAMERKIPQ